MLSKVLANVAVFAYLNFQPIGYSHSELSRLVLIDQRKYIYLVFE